MVLRFDDYEIDFEKVEIRRAGQAVAVQPQVFSVIEYLIVERDRVVTKNDLLDNVWGDRFVSESALTSRIKSARKVLGDTGAEQRVIRTVQGRGYRFVAPVAESTAPEADAVTDSPSQSDVSDQSTTADASVASVPYTDDGWPLVGRQSELTSVHHFLADRGKPGVCVIGPEHIGVSRFVKTWRAEAEHAGFPTVRVVGLPSAGSIPLAALSHILPDDVLDTPHIAEELARADIVRRARRTIEELAGEKRLVVMLENAEDLDSLTIAVLTSTMLDGTAFGISGRSPLREHGANSPATSGLLEDLPLSRLTETDVDVLLHRALNGPIARGTLSEIVDMADGRPGLLRDIVDASVADGALIREHGVWRREGPLSSTARRGWDPSQLSPETVRGAQVLALLSQLNEASALAVMGEEALDELDRLHLLSVEAEAGTQVLSLVDPLVAAAIRESISPLRRGRLKRDLTGALLQPGTDPRTISILASWKKDTGVAFDDELLLNSARTAMVMGDMATAGNLVQHIEDLTRPDVGLVQAEVALQHSQWDRAEELFTAIDVDQLDEFSAAHTLRRRAAIQVYARSRFNEIVDWMATEAERRGDFTAQALRRRRAGVLAYLGRVDETFVATSELGDARGLGGVEILLSTAAAHFHRGEFHHSIGDLDKVAEVLADVPNAWRDEASDAASVLRCGCLFHLGEIDLAAELIRDTLPLGERTRLGYFPAVAATIERAAGRPRSARQLLRRATQTSHRAAFPQYTAVVDAMFATTDLALGKLAEAQAGLDLAIGRRSSVSGELRWLLEIMICELADGLGHDPEPNSLVDLADEAQSVGAVMREADLLTNAAIRDPSRDIARRVVERVEARSATFPGQLWPLRARHVRTLADESPLEPIMSAYHELGFSGFVHD